MTQINPFTGAIIQGGQIQPLQRAEKDRQIRRMQNLGKNSALQGDRLEHQVESSDAIHAAADGADSQRQGKGKQQHSRDQQEQEPPPPHLDLTA